MINPKRFFISYPTGGSITIAVQRVIDGFYLQSSDGSFAAPFDSLTMTETMPGGYSISEDRFAWNPGQYDIVFYDAAIAIIGFGEEIILAQDQIMNSIALVALAAKNAVSQVSQALGLIQSAISSQSKIIDLLQGQVNDISFQSRQASGN